MVSRTVELPSIELSTSYSRSTEPLRSFSLVNAVECVKTVAGAAVTLLLIVAAQSAESGYELLVSMQAVTGAHVRMRGHHRAWKALHDEGTGDRAACCGFTGHSVSIAPKSHYTMSDKYMLPLLRVYPVVVRCW